MLVDKMYFRTNFAGDEYLTLDGLWAFIKAPLTNSIQFNVAWGLYKNKHVNMTDRLSMLSLNWIFTSVIVPSIIFGIYHMIKIFILSS